MKIQQISSYAFYACIAVIVVVFAMFYLVGYDNMSDDGQYTAPQFTELLLWLMYALVAVSICLMIWSGVKSVLAGGSVDDAKTGVPGTKISIATVVVTIVAIALGFVFGSSDTVTLADGTTETGFWSLITDVMIYSIGLLALVAVIAVVVNLTGVQKK